MDPRTLKILYKKEILDVIRDKKTLAMMVLLPIILYPVILILAIQFVAFFNTAREEKTYVVSYAAADAEAINELKEFIAGEEDNLDYSFSFKESDDPLGRLNDEETDLYIECKVDKDQTVYLLHYLGAVDDSSNAVSLMEEEIGAFAASTSEARARELGLNVTRILHPVEASLEDHSSAERTLGSLLGSIVPLMMLATITMTAIYTAIDTTAGEKERGTIETLLSLPVSGSEIITGKFLAVSTLAFISVVLNLLSMGFVSVYLYKTFELTGGGAVTDINFASLIPAFIISMFCVFAFAMFVSAVAMCVCSFAGSFKEANNYITPLSLIVIFTGYIAFIPGITLTLPLAFVPVANICLLIKELLSFNMEAALLPVVLVSNILYAFVAISVLGKLYRSDAVLFEAGSGDFHLFERRSNIEKGTMPGVKEALFILLVIFLVINYAGGLIALRDMQTGLVFQQLIIFAIPVLCAVYMKSDLKKVFSVKRPPLMELVRGVLLLAVTLAVSYTILYFMMERFGDQYTEVTDMFGSILEGVSFPQAVVLLAVIPAICEEVLFRGFILTALKGKTKPVYAIIITGVLFGLMHMTPIRILPTTLLGISCAYMVYRSESIFVSMTMHFINNMISVAAMFLMSAEGGL